MQLDCVGFTLIIDDIVRPNGTTYMQQLGGGGPQTLFGFQLVSQLVGGRVAKLGLAAGVGQDLPTECRDWLQAIGADVSGLLRGPLPTPRAWQLFEADGTRTQVWRVKECPELYQQLRPSFDQLPPHFQAARHFHLGIHAGHPPMKLLRALRAAAHAQGGLLSVETYTCCDSPPPEQQLRELLSVVDIFSPNAAEAESIVGPGSPQQLVQRLLELGGRTVVLRMGEQGVLLAQSQQQECHRTPTMFAVPAVPDTRVVDVTGCGNAFCGGLLAGLDAGLGLEEAGLWGCVAGSIMAEAQGVPAADALSALLPVARAKHQQLQQLRRACLQEGVEAGGGPSTTSTSATAVQCLGVQPQQLFGSCSPRAAPQRRCSLLRTPLRMCPTPARGPGLWSCRGVGLC